MQTSNQIATVVAAAEGRKFNVLGHSITAKLSRKETDGHYYVFEVITPPGHGIPPHVHAREDEIIRVMEGEFLITLGDKQFTANAGAEIFFPRNTPHAFQNVGSSAGKTAWVVVPGGNFEEFFDKLVELPPGPPDMQKVVEIFAQYGMEVLMQPA